MRITRCHIESELVAGQTLALPESAATHLIRVLRLGVGDAVILFNGDGCDYGARISSLGKRTAEVQVETRVEVARESPLQVTLAQALARGEKMDWVLQKATELGVSRIAPVVTERTEVKLDADRADRRLQHWRGVAASACEQCGRAHLPQIEEPLALHSFLAKAKAPGHLILALDPDGEHSLSTLPAFDSLSLVIGPEGGLSPRDLDQLRAAGAQGLRLGPRILRTETAGIAALAALQAQCGDWR
jgi:16S rRNA (uracil1498-N3)-methyltransferase